MTRLITDSAWRALSLRLGVDEPTLKAIAEVESAGSGFLPDPDEDPKVLFEGHAFHRLTKGRFSAEFPDLSYPKWTKGHYARTLKGEWERLRRARALDRDAANQSASWGAFQIMGFNYGLCGFSSVEAFVAAQRAGADEQLDAFAQFIGRDTFLSALRRQDWAAFASRYNGPAYAKNRYDQRLAAACAKYAAAAGRADRGPRRKRARKVVAVVKGRPEFAPPPAGGRTTALSRPVKPDPVDLRDWVYRPTVAAARQLSLVPHNPRPTSHQLRTRACTGFALAKVIEYLLERAKRPVEQISGFMLYSMARRYDEWTGNDQQDEGSSLRGALKGWAHHGASAALLWTDFDPPTPTNDDVGLVARQREAAAGRLLPSDARGADRHSHRADGVWRGLRERPDTRGLGGPVRRQRAAAADFCRRDSDHRVPPRSGGRWARVCDRRLHGQGVRRAELLGTEVGPGRLRHPDLRRLAAERHGRLGRPAGRRHQRARGGRAVVHPAPRRCRVGQGCRLEHPGARPPTRFRPSWWTCRTKGA